MGVFEEKNKNETILKKRGTTRTQGTRGRLWRVFLKLNMHSKENAIFAEEKCVLTCVAVGS